MEAKTVDGLEDLKRQLEILIDQIDENAATSRRAVEILDEIASDEEAKVTQLLTEDGPAAELLSRFTEGRYRQVLYDAEAQTIAVERNDGTMLHPSQLSRGTHDQLYFAARISITKQILGGKSGFLLLDDPFLAADQSRLRTGFDILVSLVFEGWQIRYLTARTEISEAMAREFDCDVHELERLSW